MAEEQEAKFRADAAAELHAVARDDKDQRSDILTARILDMVIGLQRDVMDNVRKEGAAVQELKEGLARVEKRVEEFVSAFPDGDAIKHRMAHEEQIKAVKTREHRMDAVKTALSILAISAICGWVLAVLWKAFLMGPK